MIALFSTLAGFLSASIPEFFKLFRENKDREHEIELLQLQINFEREKSAATAANEQAVALRHLQAVEVEADSAEATALGSRVAQSLVGVGWVDALCGTVRPMLTYCFFVMYGATKYAQYHVLTHSQLPWQHLSTEQALVILWGENDVALFTAIIGFWFGQRAILRSRSIG
jgi:hypothetical protein